MKYDIEGRSLALADKKARFTMPNGSYPIDNCSDVEDAWGLRGSSKTYSKSEVAAYVKRAAKALGCSIKDDNDKEMKSEQRPAVLATYLLLEHDGVPGLELEGEVARPNGEKAMRYRVPFYVGETIAQAPGFDQKIYFPTSILPEIVAEGRKQIQQGRQPLQVYTRHATAHSGAHLPVGAVVDLEHRGSVGYATLEIEPTIDGKDVQILIAGKKLNAVSLRSAPHRYEMSEKTVNGEDMLVLEKMAIDGMDFAPDRPVMDTYGMEVLAAEARVEDVITPKRSKEDNMEPEAITLEYVKRERPSIVLEIETPLRQQITDLTTAKDTAEQKVKALEAEIVDFRTAKAEADKEAYLQRLAATFPEEGRAVKLEALRTFAKGKTIEQVAIEAVDVILAGKPLETEQQGPTSKEGLAAALFPKAAVVVTPTDTGNPTAPRGGLIAVGAGLSLEMPED